MIKWKQMLSKTFVRELLRHPQQQKSIKITKNCRSDHKQSRIMHFSNFNQMHTKLQNYSKKTQIFNQNG